MKMRIWLIALTIISEPGVSDLTHLAEPAAFDNAETDRDYGQTFLAVDNQITGVEFYVGTDALEGPTELVLYEAGDSKDLVEIARSEVMPEGEVLEGFVAFSFDAPVLVEKGERHFFCINTADRYGIGLRDLTSSTYQYGAEASRDKATGALLEHGTGRDLSFSVLVGNRNEFTWPIDPDNISGGHYGPCGDSDHLDGCFWLSDALEERDRIWRDAQPFQRYRCDVYPCNGMYHLGADYNLGSGAADNGLPVYPAAAGIVSRVLSNVRGWGNIVFIEHSFFDETYTTMYAHVEWLESGPPLKRSAVSSENPIARVGNGVGLYPYHLHFEIRLGDDTSPGRAYSKQRVQSGPQGQIDPNAFIGSFKTAF